MKPIIYTIGHSTLTLDSFINLLRINGVNQIIDIRSIPRSRHNPQFNREILSKFLRNRHINYRHMKNLGGLRHAHKDSVNVGWTNLSFRGFADYMQTEEFTNAIAKLIRVARHKKMVIMCAEAVPWRCHRSLIGDALLVHGIKVKDIISKSELHEHHLTPWAKKRGKKLFYPAVK